jgi:hypothetical protein
VIQKDERLDKLQAEVRETPLSERLERCRSMIGKMCSEGRPPKMSIPVRSEDEDFFISTTIQDVQSLLSTRIFAEKKCGCKNMVDSGGQNPDGSWIKTCPECNNTGTLSRELTHEELAEWVSNNLVWFAPGERLVVKEK